MSDLDAVILKELLDARGEYVSGEAIAAKLDISRVSIWGRLEKLREKGFEFEAVRNKGYRIISEPPWIHTQLLDAYLLLKKISIPVIHYETIDSTNNEAERRLAQGSETPLVVISNLQTKGRGRLGREWCSKSSENLYMSFAFRPNLLPEKMKKFTLWIGLCVCNYLNEKSDIKAEIKWPNDIICMKRKLAGMLTEARIDSDHTRDLIFGIGLNVNNAKESWPDELKDIAISLAEASGKTWNMCELASGLIKVVNEAYETFISGDYQSRFIELWNRYDYLVGKNVYADCHGKIITGIAMGINEDGALIIRDEERNEKIFQAGDVSCRLI
jgi:BirA family transcriptional regulator, biotin operon repressor / biotin---[acetyl-CoA-carboxylase] ligase